MGPVPVVGEDERFPNGFTIRAEKCPNRRGVEQVLAGLAGKVLGWAEFLDEVDRGEIRAAWISGGYKKPLDRRGDRRAAGPARTGGRAGPVPVGALASGDVCPARRGLCRARRLLRQRDRPAPIVSPGDPSAQRRPDRGQPAMGTLRPAGPLPGTDRLGEKSPPDSAISPPRPTWLVSGVGLKCKWSLVAVPVDCGVSCLAPGHWPAHWPWPLPFPRLHLCECALRTRRGTCGSRS